MKKRAYELDTLKFFAIFLVFTTHFISFWNYGVYSKMYIETPTKYLFLGLTGKLGVAILAVLCGYFSYTGDTNKSFLYYTIKRYGYFFFCGLFINTIYGIINHDSIFYIIKVSLKLGSEIFPTYWCMREFFVASVISYFFRKNNAKIIDIIIFIILCYYMGFLWVAIALMGALAPNILKRKYLNKWVKVVLFVFSSLLIWQDESITTYIFDGVFTLVLLLIIENSNNLINILSYRITSSLGANSMAIFIIHPLIYTYVGKMLFGNYLSTGGMHLFVGYIICFLITCILSFPLTKFLSLYNQLFDFAYNKLNLHREERA